MADTGARPSQSLQKLSASTQCGRKLGLCMMAAVTNDMIKHNKTGTFGLSRVSCMGSKIGNDDARPAPPEAVKTTSIRDIIAKHTGHLGGASRGGAPSGVVRPMLTQGYWSLGDEPLKIRMIQCPIGSRLEHPQAQHVTAIHIRALLVVDRKFLCPWLVWCHPSRRTPPNQNILIIAQTHNPQQASALCRSSVALFLRPMERGRIRQSQSTRNSRIPLITLGSTRITLWRTKSRHTCRPSQSLQQPSGTPCPSWRGAYLKQDWLDREDKRWQNQITDDIGHEIIQLERMQPQSTTGVIAATIRRDRTRNGQLFRARALRIH